MSNEGMANSTAYVPPDINKWLANLGLANLVVIKETLEVVVWNGYSDPFPLIPVPIAPVFLTSLRQAGTVAVREYCTTCESLTDPNRIPQLTGLSGLAGLTQIYDSRPFYFTSLSIQGTAIRDFRSFAGLICPPLSIGVYQNPVLATFDGLQGLGTLLTGTGSVFVFYGSPLGPYLGPTFRPEDVAPLAGFAACNGNFSAISGNVYIPIGPNSGQELRSWDEVCAFIGGFYPFS
jgi:hypothetical protein